MKCRRRIPGNNSIGRYLAHGVVAFIAGASLTFTAIASEPEGYSGVVSGCGINWYWVVGNFNNAKSLPEACEQAGKDMRVSGKEKAYIVHGTSGEFPKGGNCYFAPNKGLCGTIEFVKAACPKGYVYHRKTNECLNQRSGEDQKAGGTKRLDLDKAAKYLGDNAAMESSGKCATAIRRALEKSGADISPRPLYAKDYGQTLKGLGFSTVSPANYQPVKGDIVVLQPPQGQTAGHIQMFDGDRWVSDFFQRKGDIYPGPRYRQEQISYEIYRYGQ